MLEGVGAVKIHGDWIPLKASVEMISGLSGHADYLELTDWLRQSKLREKTPIKLIHGDPQALEGLRVYLQEQTEYSVEVAGYRDILHL